MVSVYVCQAGHPHSSPVRSFCFKKVEFYQHDHDWFTKGSAMYYHVYVIMHVKEPQLPVVRVGHHFPLACFCLSLYSLHVLYRDVNMIQTKNNNIARSNNDYFYFHYRSQELSRGSFGQDGTFSLLYFSPSSFQSPSARRASHAQPGTQGGHQYVPTALPHVCPPEINVNNSLNS